MRSVRKAVLCVTLLGVVAVTGCAAKNDGADAPPGANTPTIQPQAAPPQKPTPGMGSMGGGGGAGGSQSTATK